MLRAVFLDWGSLDRNDLQRDACHTLPIEWTFHVQTGTAQLAARLADAEIVISNKVVLDAAALAGASRLKLICVAATGTNNIDLTAARRLAIDVTNVRGYATPSVVQHVFLLILSLLRSSVAYQQAVAGGRWRRSEHFCLLDFPIEELGGKTLGIVGYGELGQAVAQTARHFGMQVLLAQRPGGAAQVGRLPLHELLPRVDILSLHCPLNEVTRNLIGPVELALLKSSAILINAARGGIVDEAALLTALLEQRLGGAGIDVLHSEPPRAGNPLLEAKLPNLIVTPHIAWATRQARQRLLDGVLANIRAHLAHAPINLVNEA